VTINDKSKQHITRNVKQDVSLIVQSIFVSILLLELVRVNM